MLDLDDGSKRKRLDSSLESKGAEYLVLGQLLIERVVSYLAYERNAGHDILACKPDTGISCRIEVKSRWYSDGSKKVQFKSLEFDFAVLVLLNRGSKRKPDEHPQPVEFYILPVEVVCSANRGEGKLGIRFQLDDLENKDEYRDAWHLIRDHLGRTNIGISI